MEMTDLLSKEEWLEVEKDLHERFGLNACVYDDKGITFTGFKAWANRVCPVVKADKAGIQAICSPAHQNMAAQAKQSRDAVIAECDAGFTKICIPVFVNDEFVGIVGGCGLLVDDSEVDSFMVNKATGVDEAEIEKLASDAPKISNSKAEEIADYVKDKVSKIISAFKS